MSSGAWTALGTIILAAVTLAAVLTTVIITAQDRRGAERRLQAERLFVREREQLTQAYAVQVAMGEKPAGTATGNVQRPVDDSVKILAVMVVNAGQYTITGVEARFCIDGSRLREQHSLARLGGFDGLPQRLAAAFSRLEDDSGCGDVLAPGDVGMRMEFDPLDAGSLSGPYPVVRWTDRWGNSLGAQPGQSTADLAGGTVVALMEAARGPTFMSASC